MQTAAIVREQDPLPGGTNPPENPNYFCMEWNAENQLTRVTKDAAEVATFKYDPIGRRVEKVAGGVTTSYLYGQNAILQETSDGTTDSYIHGPSIDEPLSRIHQSGSVDYYHADGLGSIVKVTNTAGAVSQVWQYDSWGNLDEADGLVWAFTGREWDRDTQLYYYRARYYDSSTGRFTSEDSYRSPREPNLYYYVTNNPALLRDSYGLQDNCRVYGGDELKIFFVKMNWYFDHPLSPSKKNRLCGKGYDLVWEETFTAEMHPPDMCRWQVGGAMWLHGFRAMFEKRCEAKGKEYEAHCVDTGLGNLSGGGLRWFCICCKKCR